MTSLRTIFSVFAMTILIVGLLLFVYNIYLMFTYSALDGNQMVIGIVLLMVGIYLGKILGAKPTPSPEPAPKVT